MKFLSLKKDLEVNIRPAYIINGNDRFLCYTALKQIRDALKITMPQMNEVILSGDSTSKEEIARAVSIFPFCDRYRLVVVNDFSSKTKSKAGKDELLEYLKNPMKESILVFFNLDGIEALKPYLQYAELVDCAKLSPDVLKKVLKSRVEKENSKISDKALDKIILFCNNDMARINSELEKLISFAGENEISEDDVKSLVVEDKEYQVFELGEFIARGEKTKALDLVYSLMRNRSGFSILTPLYNNYRRALFISINKDKTDDELGNLLGVNSYAIKMMRGQVKYFTPKKLKTIVDMLYEADRNIKMGKIKEDVAIKLATLNILKIRG